MNKKTLIQLIIILGAFGGAGIVLYNGFFRNQPTPISVSLTGTPQATQNILPNGESLNFTVLHSRPFEYDQIQYPKLDPQSEVGVPVENLIKSLPTNPITK